LITQQRQQSAAFSRSTSQSSG